MAVVSQAFGTAVSGTASVNVSWPTHTTNDIGILVIESSANSLSAPSGWTLVGQALSLSGLLSSTNVYWRRAASSSESSVNTGFPSGADHMVARIHTFRGCVTTGTPILTSATATRGTGTTTWSAPSITTTTANEFVVWCAGRDNDSSLAQFGNPVNANLISPDEIAEAGTISGNGGGFTVGYGVKATAGATGTTTGTVTSSAGASVTFSLAEQPTLDTTVGAFNLSGTTTGLLRSNILNNTLSTFNLVGNNLTLSPSVNLDVTVGAFNLSGTTTELLKSNKIDATVSTFIFTGNNLILSPTVALNTTVGAFNLTGNSVDLTYTPAAGLELICQLGTFTWTGISSILIQQLILNNTAGSFAVNGLPLNQQRLFLLNGNTESFLVDGKFISLSLGKNLNTTTGTFVLNGINLDSTFTYAIIGSTRSFLIGFNPADVAKNFQLVSSTGTYTLTGISSDAVKNYPIVALPQSYLVGTTGIDYFSTRRLEASTAPFVMTLQSNGDFFWYQTTQTIPIIKPRLTNRNQWILGRATHMGRRGL
jgi:hypothetical protein